ncbi:unnamed protein product [Fusarium equiseti]|uniref:Uncharacterized protein n=1 Tax=Fusarium equiseti TaxID=61235 RepID=A0A8J2IPG8_FUSEQ|nr:unnamed protein product [Fusarium equiseti]
MSLSAKALMLQKPTNTVDNLLIKSGSDKVWARSYSPITNYKSHAIIGQHGNYYDDFEGSFLGIQHDDAQRFSEPAFPLNKRHWQLDSEADCENWFNTEIANVELSAWRNYLPLMQTSMGLLELWCGYTK